VNLEIGADTVATYTSKFHGRALQEPTLRSARKTLALGTNAKENPYAHLSR